MSKKAALQPYLEPHHWSLTAIVRRFVLDQRRALRTGSASLEDAEALAEQKFERYPDLRDFAMRQLRSKNENRPAPPKIDPA